MIGFTVVAIGTRLPELFVSLLSMVQGGDNLAIGNVVGSKLLSQPVILGLCASVSGGRGLVVDPVMLIRDLPIMVLTTLAEGFLRVALYGLDLAEQILLASVPNLLDEYSLVVLVVVLSAVLMFLVWGVLRWRRQRSLSTPSVT